MSVPAARLLTAGVTAALVFTVAGACSEGDSTGSGGNGDEGPPGLREGLEAAFGQAPGYFDAFDRLVVAVLGGPADGVAIVPSGNTVNVSVQVDTDDNGSRETTVSAAAIFSSPSYDIDEGANVSFAGPAGTFANAYAFARRTGPTTVTFTEASGGFGVPPDVIPPPRQVVVTGGTVALNLLTRNPSGQVEIEYLSELDPVFATVTFESNGGGWQMRVVEKDGAFEFVIH